ncbi:phosphate propanoyltransferase [Thermosipho melanesiensis]|uniref:Phosphate propanoyltransferase n=2 Tax=Thermosipho melanesiensis TaxID=46541 RepID=A6LL59_THEM4|nr:phosphate propanoyltransferase [Thermosipho melanesiensis]ABR30660.1 Propanediol utilization protein [Thermosipho melanesiensis BI429]APT73795.1 phosphate propanoyltransferase [Thermosipho melanesiensis]OOC35733.1 phosphate propanoyltransferase [Thermosipho melanesiensis]OOC39032.1 phosphate propanoyltransferase [Thermosipho melanesiensis]OOC39180.1 phosphate propanoyltransferase [Thermosipho melanesiensis]
MKLKQPGIVAGVSNRHVHLSREDVEVLFGKGYTLTPIKDLGQPGQFACQETVIIVGPKGAIEKVRVLGPERKETQVEISLTDAFKLGVKPPVRDSGDLDNTPGIVIVGPKGSVIKDRGVIIAKRHIHMHTSNAEKYGVKDKQIVKVLVEKEGRRLIFDDVLIRVSEKYALEFHVDTDEANAALLKTGDLVYIIEE